MFLKKNQVRIIFTILVSQFILVSLLSGVLYLKASETMKAQSRNYYTRTLQQLDRILEHTFKEVENVIAGVSRDADLYDYAQLKEEREWIRILRTNERIAALMAANESIDSIHIYFEDRKEVLDCKKGLVPVGDFYDRDFLIGEERAFLFPDWKGPRILRDSSLINPDNGKKVLTVIRPLGQVSIYNSTFIMVNIPWSYLENVIEDLGFIEEAALYIYKEDEALIPLRDRDRAIPQISDPSALLGENVELGGTRYLSTSWGASMGWFFINLLPEEVLLHEIRHLLYFTLMMSFAVLALGLLAAFILSNHLQAPISRMFRQLNGEKGVRNELAYVSGFILNQLFINPDSWSERENDNSPIDFDAPYRVLLLSFPNEDANCWNRSEKFLNSLLKNKEIKGLMVPSRKDREIIILLNANQDDKDFLKIINSRMEGDLVVGISQTVSGVNRVPLAYDQAGRALMGKVSHSRERVFLFDNHDMASDALPITISFKSENRIKELFRSGREAELTGFIGDEVSRSLNSESGTPVMVRFLFFQIIRILLDCFKEKGGKAQDLEDGEWGVLEIMHEPLTMDLSKEKLNRLITGLMKNLPDEKTDIKTVVTEKTVRYIMENMAGDLSVETIADNVYVSRSHLSKLFSEETGITLKDYIDKIRLEKAKDLLARGELRIQEIGRSVGYDNAQSFIRLFKKKEGMTPGEYQKRLPLNDNRN